MALKLSYVALRATSQYLYGGWLLDNRLFVAANAKTLHSSQTQPFRTLYMRYDSNRGQRMIHIRTGDEDKKLCPAPLLQKAWSTAFAPCPLCIHVRSIICPLFESYHIESAKRLGLA